MSHILRSAYTLCRVGIIGLIGILLLVLPACGPTFSSTASSPGSGGTANTPISRPTSTPTVTTIPGYGNTHGCPSNTVASAPLESANVTIRNTDMNSTVIAHTGDIIEIRLPFGHKWTGPTSIPTVLQEQQPAGYALASDQICIWRFVAQSTGRANLDFYWQALCLQGQMCPMFIANAPFIIDVK